jgi:DNA-binding MarR family transcriptional regulator
LRCWSGRTASRWRAATRRESAAAASEPSFDGRQEPEVRAPHGNVFRFLDDDGNQVSELARRAQITKQSMAELVAHLERHGYVERVPDPQDRRAKLVRPTDRGRDVDAIAREAAWAVANPDKLARVPTKAQ